MFRPLTLVALLFALPAQADITPAQALAALDDLFTPDASNLSYESTAMPDGSIALANIRATLNERTYLEFESGRLIQLDDGNVLLELAELELDLDNSDGLRTRDRLSYSEPRLTISGTPDAPVFHLAPMDFEVVSYARNGDVVTDDIVLALRAEDMELTLNGANRLFELRWERLETRFDTEHIAAYRPDTWSDIGLLEFTAGKTRFQERLDSAAFQGAEGRPSPDFYFDTADWAARVERLEGWLLAASGSRILTKGAPETSAQELSLEIFDLQLAYQLLGLPLDITLPYGRVTTLHQTEAERAADVPSGDFVLRGLTASPEFWAFVDPHGAITQAPLHLSMTFTPTGEMAANSSTAIPVGVSLAAEFGIARLVVDGVVPHTDDDPKMMNIRGSAQNLFSLVSDLQRGQILAPDISFAAFAALGVLAGNTGDMDDFDFTFELRNGQPIINGAPFQR